MPATILVHSVASPCCHTMLPNCAASLLSLVGVTHVLISRVSQCSIHVSQQGSRSHSQDPEPLSPCLSVLIHPSVHPSINFQLVVAADLLKEDAIDISRDSSSDSSGGQCSILDSQQGSRAHSQDPVPLHPCLSVLIHPIRPSIH